MLSTVIHSTIHTSHLLAYLALFLSFNSFLTFLFFLLSSRFQAFVCLCILMNPSLKENPSKSGWHIFHSFMNLAFLPTCAFPFTLSFTILYSCRLLHFSLSLIFISSIAISFYKLVFVCFLPDCQLGPCIRSFNFRFLLSYSPLTFTALMFLTYPFFQSLILSIR